jgi:hypothetical protein
MKSVFSSLFNSNNNGNDATRHVGLCVETNNVHGSASILFMSLIRKLALVQNFESFPHICDAEIRDTGMILIMIMTIMIAIKPPVIIMTVIGDKFQIIRQQYTWLYYDSITCLYADYFTNSRITVLH